MGALSYPTLQIVATNQGVDIVYGEVMLRQASVNSKKWKVYLGKELIKSDFWAGAVWEWKSYVGGIDQLGDRRTPHERLREVMCVTYPGEATFPHDGSGGLREA